ncbi:MAG: ABC-type transport auxiliary lipoprotein family protein [Bacteroidales bacterium]
MKIKIFLLIILIVSLVGCRSSKPVAPTFYLIEFPSDKEVDEETSVTLPFSLEILDVDVHPAFASRQIALREKEYEVRYYSHHEWAVRPSESLTRYLYDYFKRSEIFRYTDTRFWNVLPDYRLNVKVHKLEVIEDENDYLAHVHADFELIMVEGNVAVVQHGVNKTRLLEKRNLNLFAGAINDMFFEEVFFFSRKILYEFSAE